MSFWGIPTVLGVEMGGAGEGAASNAIPLGKLGVICKPHINKNVMMKQAIKLITFQSEKLAMTKLPKVIWREEFWYNPFSSLGATSLISEAYW